ncbi:MAG: EAL domain-containing protein, partial [Lysobacteraceae bacterium]
GVDDPEALAFLSEVGCDHAQGYLIAEPLQSEAFEDLLASGNWPGRESGATRMVNA